MKKSLIFAIIGLVTIFILIGGVVVITNNNKDNNKDNDSNSLISNNSNSNSVGNTNGNLVNNGMVTVQGEWIYYIIPYGDGIYKMKLDGTENQKILTEELFKKSDTFDINVVGDWIYYTNYYGDGIYKVKTDGTSNQRIASTINNVNLIVTENEIYYNYSYDTNLLHKINLKNNENKGLSEHESKSNIENGWLYMNDTNGIYKMKLDGTEYQQIYSNDRVEHIVVNDGWIYFISYNKNTLNKIKVDGTDLQIISTDFFGANDLFNVDNGWIYYCFNQSPYDPEIIGIYKIKTDGTDKQKISNDNISAINIIDEWLYYYKDNVLNRIKVNGTDKQVLNGIETEKVEKTENTTDIEEKTLASEFAGTYKNNEGKIETITLSENGELYYEDNKIDITEKTSNGSILVYDSNSVVGSCSLYPIGTTLEIFDGNGLISIDPDKIRLVFFGGGVPNRENVYFKQN